MESRKYYYLKLKDDFFDREEIRIIEKMDNGYEYVNILLKLYLRSLKRDGLLMALDAVPYDIQMIAHVTGNGIDAVKTAIEIFQKFGLLEVMEDGAMYMIEIQNFIGSSSTEADRKRVYRDKIKEIAQHIEIAGTNVQTDVRQSSTITKDKDIIKERNKYYVGEFEKLWNLYPKKDGKKEALRYFTASVTSSDLADSCYIAVGNYISFIKESKTEDKYIKNGSTFFNNWEDWIEKREVKGKCKLCGGKGRRTVRGSNASCEIECECMK